MDILRKPDWLNVLLNEEAAAAAANGQQSDFNCRKFKNFHYIWPGIISIIAGSHDRIGLQKQ